ncbi:hypothetical protein HAX54_006356 [Datura stramonium]|uniref:Uncharacterized protein n=1 Tax=Datura stramonium TaxID=4076 RepID=A0ABS8WY34_DATST|nr:hypothetical protein [Datura stramonium]
MSHFAAIIPLLGQPTPRHEFWSFPALLRHETDHLHLGLAAMGILPLQCKILRYRFSHSSSRGKIDGQEGDAGKDHFPVRCKNDLSGRSIAEKEALAEANGSSMSFMITRRLNRELETSIEKGKNPLRVQIKPNMRCLYR